MQLIEQLDDDMRKQIAFHRISNMYFIRENCLSLSLSLWFNTDLIFFKLEYLFKY